MLLPVKKDISRSALKREQSAHNKHDSFGGCSRRNRPQLDAGLAMIWLTNRFESQEIVNNFYMNNDPLKIETIDEIKKLVRARVYY